MVVIQKAQGPHSRQVVFMLPKTKRKVVSRGVIIAAVITAIATLIVGLWPRHGSHSVPNVPPSIQSTPSPTASSSPLVAKRAGAVRIQPKPTFAQADKPRVVRRPIQPDTRLPNG